MTEVMISYARADARDFAGRLAAELRLNGVDVWLDTAEIAGGANWLQALETALRACRVFIAVRSKAAKQSEWVINERLMALNRKPRPLIVPVLLNDCPDDLEFQSLQPIDFRHSFEMALPPLVERIRGDGASPPAATRRLLELEYLGRMLLEYAIWETQYTPLSGAGRRDKSIFEPEFRRGLMAAFGAKPDVERKRYTNIMEAVAEWGQLAILGDPGAGKSTTLWRMVRDMAALAEADLKAGVALEDGHALPVLLPLGSLDPTRSVEDGLQAQLGPLGAYYPQLWAEKRLTLLLDGLNELPTERREKQVAGVQALVKRATEQKMVAVVTCRELDYPQFKLTTPAQLLIDPLNPEQIRQFLRAYLSEADSKTLYQQLGGEEAERRWGWRDGDDRSLLTLASNPYMLTMLKEAFETMGHIPPNRGKLFDYFVWYRLHEKEHLSDADITDLKTRLAGLAYAMQQQGKGTGFDLETLGEHGVDGLTLYRAQSANLLTTTAPIRFTHQLLLEYFAAHQLDAMRLAGQAADTLWPREQWGKPTGWEETAILLAGLYIDDCTPILDWLRDANPELTARCIRESGASTPPTSLQALQSHWVARLTDIVGMPDPRIRAAVGRGLAVLNLDHRRGVGLNAAGLPDIEWVRIDDDREWVYQDKKHPALPPYHIARYPITYAQFQAFVDDPNGAGQFCWYQGMAAGERDRVIDEQRFKYANHPRENVNWYQMMAFCRWLTWRWAVGSQTAPLPPDGTLPVIKGVDWMNPMTWAVRLPTGQEWERAARGTEGREYPYGAASDASKGNTYETGIELTNAVGIFPQGTSADGVEEMSGNVWDWCLNEYKESEKVYINNNNFRELRGGSWFYFDGHARAARRYGENPNNRDDNLGGRVVCVRPPSP